MIFAMIAIIMLFILVVSLGMRLSASEDYIEKMEAAQTLRQYERDMEAFAFAYSKGEISQQDIRDYINQFDDLDYTKFGSELAQATAEFAFGVISREDFRINYLT